MRRREPLLWVHQDHKSEVPERLETVKKAEGHKGRCLFVIDEEGHICRKQENNNCHVIPKSKVLDQLKDNTGKVLQLRWGVRKWQDFFISSNEANPIDLNTADAFHPQRVGTGDACVGWFACKDHDNEFHPIDGEDLDFSDYTVRFLIAYRAALHAADLARVGERLFAWDKQFLNSPHMKMRAEWSKIRGTLKVEIPRARSTATRLGKIWYTWKKYGEFDPNFISGQTLFFRSRLKFAACVSYGKGLLVVVYPGEEDQHMMGLLNLAEDSVSAEEDKQRLAQMANDSQRSDNCGVVVLQETMANVFGNVAASPDSYDGLSEEEKQAILEVVRRYSSVDQMVKAFPSQLPQFRGRGGKR